MNEYQLEIADNVLSLKTSSFKAEKGSVLHSGIYNREMTSSLAAGALTLAAAIFMYSMGFVVTVIYVAVAVAVFAASFVFLRMFVFYEAHLRVVMDRSRGTIRLTEKKMFSSESTYPMGDIEGVCTGRVVFAPENPDGIEFVEKIALQHGTVIPGFGEEKVFHTVELAFKDGGKVMVFSSSEPSEAETLAAEIEKFLGVQGA
jgi:hypothetical protein